LIQNELSKLRCEEVSEKELTRAKDMILGAILREVDNPVTLPETLVSMEMLFADEKALANYVQKIQAVKAEDIVTVANKYLQERSLSTVTLRPKPS
jgi:predicted Zn-dependent peptidase